MNKPNLRLIEGGAGKGGEGGGGDTEDRRGGVYQGGG